MEIQPASVDQLAKGKNGNLILITNDVGNVAADLRRISDDLRLRYSDAGDYYVVYREYLEDGIWKHTLVTTSTECDQRLVKRVEYINSPLYNYAEEVDKLDKAADKAREDAFSEKIGEVGEKIAWAVRKDLGEQRDAARSKVKRVNFSDN